ncbi:MAG: ABC transporter ATP-binding protein [Acidimicrobiales bacterium]
MTATDLTSPIIEVRGLTKRFGPVLAVDNLSFEVHRGRVTAFLGPNGAGKTTTLRTLLGLVSPSGGTATIAGQPYPRLADPARTVGAVLESSGFHPGRSAIEHLRVLATAGRLPRERAGEVLTLVGLAGVADRRVGGFSLGMRQRLGLAAALIGNPGVLILDEPANGLDPEGVHWLRSYLRRFADAGGTVLVSSHLLSEVAQLADDVVILARGRLVAQGPLASLTDGLRAGRVRVRSPQRDQLEELLGAMGIRWEAGGPDVLIARGTTSDIVGQAAADDGIVLYELTPAPSNLEDVFLDITAEAPPPS